MKTKVLSLLLAALMLMTMLASCTTLEGDDKGAILDMHLTTEVFDFDPQLSMTDDAQLKYMSLMFEGLTRINEKGETVYTWANEGSGNVEQIITDLVARGYHGGFSMEPHLALVFHDESVQNPEEVKKQTYIEYGRRCEALIRKIYGC